MQKMYVFLFKKILDIYNIQVLLTKHMNNWKLTWRERENEYEYEGRYKEK